MTFPVLKAFFARDQVQFIPLAGGCLRELRHMPRFLILLLIALHLAAFGPQQEAKASHQSQPQKPSPAGQSGDWVLEMRSIGGLHVRVSTLLIRSDGHFEKKEAFKTSTQTGTLPAPALEKLNRAILAAKLSTWKDDYNEPGDNGCCDRIRTTLELRVCGPDGKWTKYEGGWEQRFAAPPDLEAVLAATEF
jgi:hypothetical protein